MEFEHYISGLFALAGVLLAGLFTYAAARLGHDWNRARRHLNRLADQVASYHALEHEYIQALYSADPELGSPRTIQTAMRDRVELKDGFIRPTLTTKEARHLQEIYS